jgi:farnesyl-diphosphate farnesyltransferase
MMSDGVEHASGKDRQDENFPVGSMFIPKALRRHVHCFYRFARNADDVADAADLESEEKLRRLDRMGEVLDGAAGDDAPAALRMRQSIAETGVGADHCHDLLNAFRQDSVKSRYVDWGELMDYCNLSAAPVGRYLLDLHGETRDCWPASDALCAALQVINHLQDCREDFLRLDRVYIPAVWMAEAGCSVEDLGGDACTGALRQVLDRAVKDTGWLVEQSRSLPGQVRHRGLRLETAVIVALADRLAKRLSRQDPLAERVRLAFPDIIVATLGGLVRSFGGGAR